MSSVKQVTLVSLEELVPEGHIYRRFVELWTLDRVEKQLKVIEKENNYKGYGALRLFKCLLLQFM